MITHTPVCESEPVSDSQYIRKGGSKDLAGHTYRVTLETSTSNASIRYGVIGDKLSPAITETKQKTSKKKAQEYTACPEVLHAQAWFPIVTIFHVVDQLSGSCGTKLGWGTSTTSALLCWK